MSLIYLFYSNGEVIVTTKIPDTITSWVASAFALSNIAGFGISPETAKVLSISGDVVKGL